MLPNKDPRPMATLTTEQLTAAVAALQAELAALKATPAGGAHPALAADDDGALSPETLAILAAVATAYLGQKVRIRSARPLPQPFTPVYPWAQLGRLHQQASAHDLHRPR